MLSWTLHGVLYLRFTLNLLIRYGFNLRLFLQLEDKNWLTDTCEYMGAKNWLQDYIEGVASKDIVTVMLHKDSASRSQVSWLIAIVCCECVSVFWILFIIHSRFVIDNVNRLVVAFLIYHRCFCWLWIVLPLCVECVWVSVVVVVCLPA